MDRVQCAHLHSRATSRTRSIITITASLCSIGLGGPDICNTAQHHARDMYHLHDKDDGLNPMRATTTLIIGYPQTGNWRACFTRPSRSSPGDVHGCLINFQFQAFGFEEGCLWSRRHTIYGCPPELGNTLTKTINVTPSFWTSIRSRRLPHSSNRPSLQ